MVLAQSLVVTLAVLLAPAAEDMGGAGPTFAAAEQRLAAGDPDGAIALYERGLELLPNEPGYAPTRAEVLLTIVTAHEAAFKRDRDLERLLRAKALLDRYLGPLELLDEQGRAAAEDRRVRLIDQVAAVQSALQAAAEARAVAARRARAEAARRKARRLTIVGAGLTGFGAAGLVMMATGLGLGRGADKQIAGLKADRLASGDDWSMRCVDEACRQARHEQLDPLLARGSAGNVLAIVGAVTGGALLAAGTALLVVGRKQRREARALEISSAPAIGPASLGVVVVGRF